MTISHSGANTWRLLLVLLISAVLTAVYSGPGNQAAYADSPGLGGIVARINRQFPDVPLIEAQSLKDNKARKKVILVDVRSPREREISMLPGAVSLDKFAAGPDKFKGRTVVPYCTIGVRSAQIVRAMARHGIKAQNLSGGLLAWIEAGNKIYQAGRQTKEVFAYGDLVSLLPPGYQAVK